MYLTLDIGNTRTKLTVFDQGLPVRTEAIGLTDAATGVTELDEAVDAIRKACSADWQAVAWCATGQLPDGFDRWAESLASCVLCVTGTTPTPLQVAYHTPQTLGADRLAAAVGAVSLQPLTNLLVIDIGTCITYDIVLGGHTYLGGNISPGLRMRLDVLHEHTAALPLVAPDGDCPLVGTDTTTALRSGVILGMRSEIEGVIRRMDREYPGLHVWMTGGDALGRLSLDHVPMHSDSTLVARGLYQILQHVRTTTSINEITTPLSE